MVTSRHESVFPTEEGETRTEVWIHYRYKRMPPGLVRIPKEDYTLEVEKDLIRAQIEERLEEKPETLKV